jgi:hypothetical protein
MEKRLLIKEPRFGGELDEKAFFEWLQAIGGVTTVRGIPSGLEVYLDSSSFD